VLHLVLARSDDERRILLRSIGPVWDGNEVWLLAAGGSLVLAFPRLYASSFSGFYLPLMMVLWLLILRAIALELRGHVDASIWRQFWDVTFSVASLLLCIFFGAALGNVVRGVPLDASGHFFQALWADPVRPGRQTGILDPYTVVVGVTALAALTFHGALWVRMKAEGSLRQRAITVAARVWWALLALTAVVTAYSLWLQPQILHNLKSMPLGTIFPLLALAGLVAARLWMTGSRENAPFLASCAYLAGMLSSAAFGLYPLVLPAVNGVERSLTIHNAAAGHHALTVAFVWWIPGMILAIGYFLFIYRYLGGKTTLEGEGY